jgi:hypothetical protein
VSAQGHVELKTLLATISMVLSRLEKLKSLNNKYCKLARPFLFKLQAFEIKVLLTTIFKHDC